MESLYQKASKRNASAIRSIYTEFGDRVLLVLRLLLGADGAAETVYIKVWDQAFEKLFSGTVGKHRQKIVPFSAAEIKGILRPVQHLKHA